MSADKRAKTPRTDIDSSAGGDDGFYALRYRADNDASATAVVAGLHISRHNIIGVDDRGVRYWGACGHDADGRFHALIILDPSGCDDAREAAEDTQLMRLDLPRCFADGQVRPAMLHGQIVRVTFERLRADAPSIFSRES